MVTESEQIALLCSLACISSFKKQGIFKNTVAISESFFNRSGINIVNDVHPINIAVETKAIEYTPPKKAKFKQSKFDQINSFGKKN